MRWFLALGCAALSISLSRADCPIGNFKPRLLSYDLANAKVIFTAKVLSSKLKEPNNQNGEGTSELAILERIRDHPLLPPERLTVNSYLPVDAKTRYVVLCDVFEGKLDPFMGRAFKPPSDLPGYMRNAPGFESQGRMERLAYYFPYLDHAEHGISLDAFHEWADVNSGVIALAARRLPKGSAAKLRRWVQNPKTEPHRLGLYGFMLSQVSDQPLQDAALLKKLIARPAEKNPDVFYQGLMAGYLKLVPGEETWRWFAQRAYDPKNSFADRFRTTLPFLQFQHFLEPLGTRRHAVDLLAPMLKDPEMADLAIERLRTWRLWSHSQTILGVFGKEDFDAPITRRTIVRYALDCPQPICRQFIDNLRRQDAELVQDVEETLELERAAKPNP